VPSVLELCDADDWHEVGQDINNVHRNPGCDTPCCSLMLLLSTVGQGAGVGLATSAFAVAVRAAAAVGGVCNTLTVDPSPKQLPASRATGTD
jgi:hypothetical protein